MFWMAIGYFGKIILEAMNIIGVVVTAAWLYKECNWGFFIALFASVLFSHIPIVGTILAIVAVVQTWDWNPLLAIVAFGWHWILFIYCASKYEKEQ
jgi:hypothetical protein